MSLIGFISDFFAFVSSFTYTKTDFTSTILSESSVLTLTIVYYKCQYLTDCVYFAFTFFYSSLFGSVSSTTLNALVTALKFLLLIALLIFIRGGIPRYRFDHLTKVGWIKYLSLVLASMLIQFLLLWMC